MELEELKTHWTAHRATTAEDEILSEEALYHLLPAEKSFSVQRWLILISRRAAVYGFLFLCCQSC